MRHLLFATTMLSVLSLAVPAIAQEAGVGVGAGVGASAGGVSGGGIGAGAAGTAAGGAAGGIGGSDAGIGSTAGSAGIGVDSNAGVGASMGAQSVGSTEAGAPSQALGSVDTQAIVGSAVVSSDGAQIGIVTDVATDANGQIAISVDLEDALGINTKTIRMRGEHTAFVDQQVRLNVTRANFVSSLKAHLGAEASGG